MVCQWCYLAYFSYHILLCKMVEIKKIMNSFILPKHLGSFNRNITTFVLKFDAQFVYNSRYFIITYKNDTSWCFNCFFKFSFCISNWFKQWFSSRRCSRSWSQKLLLDLSWHSTYIRTVSLFLFMAGLGQKSVHVTLLKRPTN